LKIKGIYLLYRTLQALGSPLLLLYFLYRCLWDRGYWRTLPQRLGFLPRSFRQTGPGAIWLHAVSVGEITGCVEFLRLLRAEFPNSSLFVSTSTLAGRATAGDMLGGLADGIFYAPVDYVCIVRRVLRMLKPSVVAIAETEIWPNLLRETRRTGAAIAIVNGRISDRAISRYRKLAWLFRAVLPAVDAILAVERLRDQVTPHLLISEIRTIAADNLWMSTAYRRPSVTIHFTWKPDWPAVRRLLPVIEKELSPFQPCPHWGKLFTLSPAEFRSRHERLGEFIELATKYDLKGKFRNDFLNSYVFTR